MNHVNGCFDCTTTCAPAVLSFQQNQKPPKLSVPDISEAQVSMAFLLVILNQNRLSRDLLSRLESELAEPLADGLFDFFLIILGVGSANAEAVRNGRVGAGLLQRPLHTQRRHPPRVEAKSVIFSKLPPRKSTQWRQGNYFTMPCLHFLYVSGGNISDYKYNASKEITPVEALCLFYNTLPPLSLPKRRQQQ